MALFVEVEQFFINLRLHHLVMIWVMSMNVCGGMMMNWSSDNFVDDWCWMNSWGLVNDCVESIVVISGIVNSSD